MYVSTKSFKKLVYLLLYVDDMLLAGSTKEDLKHVRELLKIEFDMEDSRESKRILDIKIDKQRNNSELYIS